HEHGRDRVVVDQEPPPEGGGQGFARGTLGLGAHRMPGSMPFMPRIILASPPFCMRFIMVCICSNCLSRRLTSCTGTPAPAAMRRLREALIVSGRLRSDGVMEWMIPCMRRIWRSAWLMSAPAAACWNWAGSLSRSDPRPPILFIWPSWARKSLRSKRLPDLSLSASWRAAAWSTFRWASSTSETMSPMPRMRLAIRSGWKVSRPSSFSPTPTNLIGAPVMARTDRAAPPRESPSSLVRTTPVSGSASPKARATFTASWPCIASTTNRVSTGRRLAWSSRISVIICSSIASRPAVSTISTSWKWVRAHCSAAAAISTGFWSGLEAKKSAPAWPATVRSCSIAAGRYTSHETVRTFFFWFSRSHLASLPTVVVLPAPWRPAIRTTAGGAADRSSPREAPPMSSTSSRWTTPTSAWPGVRLPTTSSPSAFSLTLAMKSRTTGKETSASNNARRTSRSISCVLASVSRAWPRMVLTTRDRRVVRLSSMDMNRLHFLMDKGIVLHGLAACGYVLLMIVAWRVTATQPAARPTRYERLGLALVLMVHGWGLQQLILPQGHLHFGFASSVSITVWLGMLVFWFESLWVSIGGFRLWALPLGVLATLLPIAFPTTQIVASADSGWLRIHLGLALSAYCLVSVAALHAVLMATSDRHLHQLGPDSRADGSPSWRARRPAALPPVPALESRLLGLLRVRLI